MKRKRKSTRGETRSLRVAGIGASAGGLHALQEFFDAVPAKSGIAFVVLLHQHAGEPTVLAELLAKHSKLEVVKIEDGMRLQPDRVHVAPPGCELGLDGAKLSVSAGLERPPRPIDRFFRSLARSSGENAIAVVLSGTGTDGTTGAADIRAAGGIVAVQEPASAAHAGMPRSVLAAHAVDLVLPPGDLPRALARIAGHRSVTAPEAVEAGALQEILATLRTRTGQDMSAYRRSMLDRRIERRMTVCGIDEIGAYAEFVRESPVESDALFRELLVSVTTFFRDPAAFDALRTALLEMVLRRGEPLAFRAWVPGCATGEEAYSLAMLVREVMDEAGKSSPVQIFATDVDHHALTLARVGRYPAGIAADVSAARLQRFFDEDGAGYRVKKSLREMIVFAAQNVIRDPPFNRLDLVSCRNLLIYLEPEAKRRVIRLLAYGLRPGGLLLLGSSESVMGHDETLQRIDAKNRLFRRSDTAVVSAGDLARPARRRGAVAHRQHGEQSDRALLSLLAPPGVVATSSGQIAYVRGIAAGELEPAQGQAAVNVLELATNELRRELAGAIRRAGSQHERIVCHGVKVTSSAGSDSATLAVKRLAVPKRARGMLLVSLALQDPAVGRGSEARAGTATGSDDHVGEFEAELRRTRDELGRTVEALHASNDEIAQANEQLQSANEELNTANQQLEISREELQSLNMELQTVNTELLERNGELARSNDDLRNLLDVTGVAILFLDENLAIRRFNEPARVLLHLIDADLGRPLRDMAASLHYAGLVGDVRAVLATGSPMEREVQTSAGGRSRLRVVAYRTAADAVSGVVVALADVHPVTSPSRDE